MGVEDVAEAAASVELAPVEGDVVEEAADPVELAPVVDDCDDDAAPVEEAPVEDDVADVAAAPLELAPVIEVASPVTVEHEEVEIIEIEDADESMEITPAFEGSGDCLSDTTLSGSLVSPVDEFDDNDASDAGDEQDDSLLAEKEDEMTEKEEKIAASDIKSTVEEDINVTSH